MSLWTLSYVLLWAFSLAMFLLLVAVSRQVGLLHKRVPPVGAREAPAGPQVGDVMQLPSSGDFLAPNGVELKSGKPSLALFLSTTCSLCSDLSPAIRTVSRTDGSWLNLVLVILSDSVQAAKFLQENGLEGVPSVAGLHFGDEYQVSSTPYAIAADSSGVVLTKGLVNHLEHLESLVTAIENSSTSNSSPLLPLRVGTGEGVPEFQS